MGLESVDKAQVEEATLRKLRRSLYTDIPSSYMENIIDGVVPVIGVDFEGEKDVYTVKVVFLAAYRFLVLSFVPSICH